MAICRHHDHTVAFFKKHLKPVTPPNPVRLRQLLGDLRSERFPIRDKAAKELEKLGELAEKALLEEAKQKLPLEAQRRVEQLLARLQGPARTAEQRVASRALETLEILGGASVRALVQSLAEGAPDARLTRQARETLDRLDARPAAMAMRNIKPPRLDNDGDPLPEGVLTRMGTTRFRFPGYHFLGNLLFGPDRRSVVVWTHLGRLVVFDLPSGKTRMELVPPPWPETYRKAAFSPDGKFLALAGSQGVKEPVGLQLIDWPTCKAKPVKELAGVGRLMAMTFLGPDQLALVEEGGTVRVWDLTKHQEIRKVACPFKAQDHWLFSPDGQWLVAHEGYRKSKLFLWPWQTEKPVQIIKGPEDKRGNQWGFHRLIFSPDGRTLATHSQFDTVGVRLWDVASAKSKRHLVIEKDRHLLEALVFSPNGHSLVGLPYHGNALIDWDLKSGEIRKKLPWHCMSGSLAYSPDGRFLAAMAPSGLRLWDTAQDRLLLPDNGHLMHVREIVCSADGRLCATATHDGTVRLWDLPTGQQRHLFHHDAAWIRALAFPPNGKLLASSGFDDTVRIWDVETGKQRHRLPGHGGIGGYRVLRFTPDGKRLVSWGDDLHLRVFDVATGNKLREFSFATKATIEAPGGDQETYASAALLPDGSQLVLITHDGKRLLHETTSGKLLRKFDDDLGSNSHLVIAPNQKSFLTWQWSFSNKALTLRQWPNGTMSVNVPMTHFEVPPAYASDSRSFAALGPKGIVIWEAATGLARATMPVKDRREVQGLAFTPDQRGLIAGLSDGTAVVYDLPQLATKSIDSPATK